MIPGSANPLLLKSAAAAAGGYQVSRSLRFNSSDSGFCSRTPAVAGNRKTWTWAGWVKRSKLTESDYVHLFGHVNSSGSVFTNFIFKTGSDSLQFFGNSSGVSIETANLLRDPSAWYHLVLAVDTTQATAANRAKIYINGVEAVYATDNRSSTISQNADLNVNNTVIHEIGGNPNLSATRYFNGYLADVHFIDGQALTPSSFTEVSATTGQLIPLAYSGSFGTNGFWLKFSDNSAATAATLGKDYSGNSNNWTPNNLSVTAGAGNDSLVDTPTSYGTGNSGGDVRGNYCTLNPLDNSSGMTLANGNLDGSETGGGHKGTRATIKFPASGKWYYEGTVTTLGGACCIGAATNAAANPDINASGSYYILVNSSGNVQRYQSFASYTGFDTPAVGTILRVAYDADAQKLWLGLNGLWMNSSTGTTGDPATGANATFSSITDIYPAIDQQTSAVALNFGQRAFAYTAPSGFKALCDTNLGAPLVAKPNTLMDVVKYDGNGGTTSLTTSFSPDMVWIKSRSAAYYHRIFDQIRGAQQELYPNATDAEATATGGSNIFTSSGFNVASDYVNTSGQSFVAWMWDAGTTTASNGSGSITSQVRANVSAGFSIVTYTGNSVQGATVGHGLGVVPSMVIYKGRVGSLDWLVYHASLGATQGIYLNQTLGATTSANFFNNTAPNSSTLYLNSSPPAGQTNETGYTYVAYCFAPVVGYSSMGSYVGNGSSDGPFIYTGFRPRWVMIKLSSTAGNPWLIFDSARSTYNVVGNKLAPNSAVAEDDASIGNSTQNTVDFLSNGFKPRTADNGTNGSTFTYIYAAFAENPFQYARAR